MLSLLAPGRVVPTALLGNLIAAVTKAPITIGTVTKKMGGCFNNGGQPLGKCAADTWIPDWQAAAETSSSSCDVWATDDVWGAAKDGTPLAEACKTQWAQDNCASTCCRDKDEDAGPYSCDDATILGLADSWYYDWGVEPDKFGLCSGRPRAAEYVPMIEPFEGDIHEVLPSNYKALWRQAGVRHLLGFNEPDLNEKLLPADAATLWPQAEGKPTRPSIRLPIPRLRFLPSVGAGLG